jgi:hypothetical protein
MTVIHIDNASRDVSVTPYNRGVNVASQGAQGPPGPPLDVLGSLASSAVLPESGNPGEAYIASDTSHLWVYGSNGWVDTGILGGESQSYTHTQGMASATWTVTHNLGRHPAIHIEDSVGNVVHGSIQHVSDSQAIVTFASVVTGTAVCS